MPRPGFSPLYQLDFENPILEIERQIDAIEERPDAERYASELKQLNETRESMLRTPGADVLPALIDAQARCEQPVQVVPIVVLWNRSPEPARTEVGRFLLGTEDHPGILGKLLALAKGTGGRDARVQVGEPVSLLDYASRVQEEPPARRVKERGRHARESMVSGHGSLVKKKIFLPPRRPSSPRTRGGRAESPGIFSPWR